MVSNTQVCNLDPPESVRAQRMSLTWVRTVRSTSRSSLGSDSRDYGTRTHDAHARPRERSRRDRQAAARRERVTPACAR